MISTPPPSRFGRDIVRATAVLATALLVVTVGSAIVSGFGASAAGINAGALLVRTPAGAPLSSGGSATPFTLIPPAGAACSGDTATNQFFIESYIVPANVNPATLMFDSGGPTPQGTGANLRQPLFSQGNPFIDGNTGIGTGAITGLPAFDFAVFGASGPAIIPPGTYNLGIACIKGPPSATQEDKFWNVQFTFSTDPTDVPSGITWVVGAGTPPTTTTTTTTTSTTTTTVAPTTTSTTTTTTVAPTTTTTVPDGNHGNQPPMTECRFVGPPNHRHEVCRPAPRSPQPKHHSTMRIWRW